MTFALRCLGWLVLACHFPFKASARSEPQVWNLYEVEERHARRLQQNASLTSSIASPAPLSVIQSPCCCIANATAIGGQTCCCGDDRGCCSETQNVTADSANFCKNGCAVLWTFVGVAAAFLVALMLAIYFRRHHLLSAVPVTGQYTGMRPFAGRSRRRKETPRIPMQALPTSKPPPEDDGKPRECPVCLEENSSNDDWTVFPCKHATCVGCYSTLCKGDPELCICPMCRMPLMQPVPDASRKWELTSTDGRVPMLGGRGHFRRNTAPIPGAIPVAGGSGLELTSRPSGTQSEGSTPGLEQQRQEAESEFEVIPIGSDTEAQSPAAHTR